MQLIRAHQRTLSVQSGPIPIPIPDPKSAQAAHYLTFMMAVEMFAIDVSAVIEVLEYQDVKNLPMKPVYSRRNHAANTLISLDGSRCFAQYFFHEEETTAESNRSHIA
jgi:hypothetical protein